MVEVPHFCSLRPKTGQLSPQASLIPLLQGELLGMQISQGSGLLPESSVFLMGLSLRDSGKGGEAPADPTSDQGIRVILWCHRVGLTSPTQTVSWPHSLGGVATSELRGDICLYVLDPLESVNCSADSVRPKSKQGPTPMTVCEHQS